ncbi:helix-turn-helix domain-containing protein [Saccharomonospora sp. NPDC046836]|uniref:ArsR/SmtB family transcription factor n=1 Tax=Saccharomonospora sp. NPDC046836 TaxID=3156921 RepID=UPI0033E41F2A
MAAMTAYSQQTREDGEIACSGFAVSVSKSTLAHHLRTLGEAGIIASRAQGTTRLNWLRRKELDELCPDLLNGILAARH